MNTYLSNLLNRLKSHFYYETLWSRIIQGFNKLGEIGVSGKIYGYMVILVFTNYFRYYHLYILIVISVNYLFVDLFWNKYYKDLVNLLTQKKC